MCVCAPKSGRARCVDGTQKTVATHTLKIIMYLPNSTLLTLRIKIIIDICLLTWSRQVYIFLHGHHVKFLNQIFKDDDHPKKI